MLKRALSTLLLTAALLVGGLAITPTPSAAAPDAPATVDRPAHNETTLSLFTCAAIRNSTGHGNLTINHSHAIAAESTTDPLTGQPAITAYDCEGYVNVGLNGCVYRGIYVHDNKLNGSDVGILPDAVRVTCWGF